MTKKSKPRSGKRESKTDKDNKNLEYQEEKSQRKNGNEEFEKITNKQEINPNVRITQTETLADMVPEIRQKGFVKVGIVYSERTKANNGRFTFVGITKEGKIEEIESLGSMETTTTGQNVTSINSRDGSIIEKEQVAGMVKLNNRNTLNGMDEYFSVKMGSYGIVEVDYVRRELSKEKGESYFSSPVETTNQRATTMEVREMMDKHHNTSMDDELEKSNPEIERAGKTKIENIDNTTSNDSLTVDDIIVLEDGSKTTIRKEAKKAKVTPEEFLKKYETTSGKTAEEVINNVHEEIEEEFLGQMQRKR